MMKFIHLTDPHLVAPGQLLHTLDPLARFELCIESINEREDDAEMVVITGDLADKGQVDAYRALAEALRRLVLPYHLLIGNHDHRRTFLSVFGDAWEDANGFVQGAVHTRQGWFLFLDTAQDGQSPGVYCAKRCAWLTDALVESGSEPVYLFMHHPPFDVHIPFLDNIGLLDREDFFDVVEGYTNIKHLFFGHVHRPISGSWRGIPFSTLTSTNHQVALDMRGTMGPNFWDEAPTYSLVLLDGDTSIVHTFPYMNNQPLPL